MTPEQQFKQAVLAFLCKHPDTDSYVRKAFPKGRPLNADELLTAGAANIAKEDLFIPDDNGKYIVNSAASWRNFAVIAETIKKNGDRLSFADFTRPLGSEGSSTLLSSAGTFGALEKIFAAKMWQGRYEEMENLWYVVSPMVRRNAYQNNGEIPLGLKRDLFAFEGKAIPEDALAKSGLTPADIRNAFIAKGNFEGLNHKLEKAGDYLRKDYLLLKNGTGNTVFNESAAWNYYDKITKNLKAHNEQLEVKDFLQTAPRTASILAQAAENNSLHKIFTPEHWENRLVEMLQLWSNVRPGWKVAPITVRDFDNAYAAAESKTFAPAVRALSLQNKTDLLSPLNVPSESEKPVLFLGMESFWNSYAIVPKNITESLTLTDLRRQSGQQGNSCLLQAAKLGHFDKVAAISRQSNEKIQIEDFLSKDSHGKTLLNILEERNELAAVFSSAIWVGRANEMKTLWAHVGVSSRKQVDFGRAEVAVHQATMKRQKPGLKFKRPPAA